MIHTLYIAGVVVESLLAEPFELCVICLLLEIVNVDPKCCDCPGKVGDKVPVTTVYKLTRVGGKCCEEDHSGRLVNLVDPEISEEADQVNNRPLVLGGCDAVTKRHNGNYTESVHKGVVAHWRLSKLEVHCCD